MTLIELKFIVAVAQARNFRKASEKCFVTQPALSLGIKKLEQELGVAIFERSRKEVNLTEIGEKIVAQANIILEQAVTLKAIAQSGANQLDGLFKLGVIHSVGPYLLPEVIPVLREIAAHMPLEIEETITSSLVAKLKNGIIDAAIIALPFDVPSIETLALYDEAFAVVIPKNHHWAERNKIKPTELGKERVLLLNSEHCFSNQVTQACPELTGKNEALQGNSLETIRNMVASNLGITVLPCCATTGRYKNPLVKSVPFEKPVPMRRIALAWRKSYARVEAVEKIAEAIFLVNADYMKALV